MADSADVASSSIQARLAPWTDEPVGKSSSLFAERQVKLLELLERILDKGVVIVGDATISVAGVDLIYLSLRLLLTSVEALEHARHPATYTHCTTDDSALT